MSTMAWLTTFKRSTTDLLLPRTGKRAAGGKEPQSPPSSPCESRPPSPLLEELPLLTPPPLLHAVASTSARRSVVTHAVLGSEIAGLHSLPHELLFLVFTRLDASALCRLAQASHSCRALADDELVWRGSPVGHCKETERVRSLHARQLALERRAAEERWRQQRLRRWKRRALGLLQAVCGVALILLPVVALLRRRSAEAALGKADRAAPVPARLFDARAAAAAAPAAGLADASARAAQPKWESVVWAAATCTRAA